MIQIQDDHSTNQVVAASGAAATPSNSGAASVSVATPHSDSAQAKQNAEIDRLLAELDKLSKELEEDKEASVASAAPTASATPVAPAMTTTSSAADSADSAHDSAQLAAAMAKPDTVPSVDLTAPAVKESTAADTDKFDFDAFLADLEKKIDEESAKNKTTTNTTDAAAASATTTDFRQTRQPAEPSHLIEPAESSAPAKPVGPTEPVVAQSTVSAAAAQDEAKDSHEDLKSQNIFDMLGLTNISDEEKNQFLDELEMMIWDDFTVHDLELLLTSEEYSQARQILDDQGKTEDERKEALVVFLEKLIPDLDEVLYEKALELKSEMMAERLAKMKEGASEEVLAKIKQAEAMISQNQWRSAANLLNSP